MKSFFKVLLIIILLFGLVGCGGNNNQETTDNSDSTETELVKTPVEIPQNCAEYSYEANGTTIFINTKTGLLTGVENQNGVLRFDGLLVDIGLAGKYVSGSLTYAGYDALSSTVLPQISPKANYSANEASFEVYQGTNRLWVKRYEGNAFVEYCYEMTNGYLSLTVSIGGVSETKQLVNGVAFTLLGMDLPDTVEYEFPGNMPYGSFDLSYRRKNIPNTTMFCNAVTHFYSDNQNWNILFLDNIEKWATGVWKDENGKANLCNLAAVECKINSAETQEIGTLYIQMPSSNPYQAIQDLYADLGYSSSNEQADMGVIYCCHPYGTTDTNYALKQTFNEFSSELQTLKAMGVETIWVMPITLHGSDSEIYAPSSLTEIDERFGGAEQFKAFVNQAHSLGMKVILDVVVHGVKEMDASAQDKSWTARGRMNQLLYEWECLSADYANKNYQAYVTSCIETLQKEYNLDGVRIDCAMGSRSNWARNDENRPSASTLYGGVSIVEAIASGLGDEATIIIPEMFYPIPNFANATDFYYNNALYRVLWDLNTNYKYDRTTYTQKLMSFLDIQNKTMVEGQILVNWLENHDTVSWSGEAKRAEAVYGDELVKNMYRFISWINGVPVIYQGDENTAKYAVGNTDLTDFFAETMQIREDYLQGDLDIEYLFSDKPVFAFNRIADDGTTYTVLLNLSGTEQQFSASGTVLFSDNADLQEQNALLGAYGCLVIRCN